MQRALPKILVQDDLLYVLNGGIWILARMTGGMDLAMGDKDCS